MSPRGWGPGVRRRGRPPWWPEDEPWPPVGPPGPRVWLRARHRFLRRAVVFLTVVAILAIAVSRWVASAVPARQFPGVIVALSLVIAFMAYRAFSRLAAPIADLIQALGRVADGDYTTRARERGSPEVRTLARAFNAMAERLGRQDAQRRALLTDISHELRTPLSVVQGQLEGMLDGVYPRDPDHLKVALEETQLLARLVEDLRTLTLTDSLELRLERTPTDVASLAGEVVASFRGQAADAGVALAVEADSGLASVEVDRERIGQVLQNLLANALRYTPVGGTVRVRCAPSPGGVAVSVEDTGRGIAPADLPHVFERFYRSRESRGAGLGLAIARGLVRAHGGEITAESAPGRGTVIQFTLPRGAADVRD